MYIYKLYTLLSKMSRFSHKKIRINLFKNLFTIRYLMNIMHCHCFLCNVYNMSGRVVSDIQTRAVGESLYIRYNTDANVVNNLKNDSSYEFIGEVILKINVV